jgi:hypothetical protein
MMSAVPGVKAMATASVLDAITVESPCTVPWNSMHGDDRSRFCSQCRRYVFNIAEMSRAEAEYLIQATTGRLCARYYRRADGTVATKDCRSRWRQNLVLAMSLLFASVIAMFGWLIGTSSAEDRYDNWMRRTEPFASVLEWIDPQPHYLASEICPPRINTQTPPAPTSTNP